MVDVYLFKSGMALFKAALSSALKKFKKRPESRAFFISLHVSGKRRIKKITDKKNPRFWGKPRIEIGDIYYCYKMDNHLLEIKYRGGQQSNHVCYCIVMYSFIEKCIFELQLFLNV